MKNRRGIAFLAVVAAAAAFAAASAADPAAVVYDNTLQPLTGGVLTVPFEPTGTSEFGDRVAFAAGAPRSLSTVTVVLGSFGCQAGHFFSGDCVSAKHATFSLPVTVNLYSVGPANVPGTLLGTATQTFFVPYRPSADSIHCSGGAWFDPSSGRCFSSKAATITFGLTSLHVVLPDQVIVSIAFNTTHYGYNPVGTNAACNSSSGGCGYDWLSIGLADPATRLSAGSNPAPSDAYQDTLFDSCSNGAIVPFGLDAGCWTGLKLAVQLVAKNRGEAE
jgi:hypothetical protein